MSGGVSFSQVWDHIKKNGIQPYTDTANLIIRPPRANYPPAALGPPVFRIQTTNQGNSRSSTLCFKRYDLTIENMRGLILECSWYRPYNVARPDLADPKPLPCVVYCHGNSGCRLDGQEILYVLEKDMTVFTFDFSGSGRSGGEFVSLGIYERQDIAAIVEHLRASPRLVTTIALWGRSMGSVSSIMYASRDPSISCLVLDSPFSTLHNLIADLVAMHASYTPDLVIEFLVQKVRRRIIKLAQFDIDELDVLAAAKKCTVPCFIFHGKDDDFVRPHHSQWIADVYGGSALRHEISGGHNDERQDDARLVALSLLELYLIQKPLAEKERASLAQKNSSSSSSSSTTASACATSAASSGFSTPSSTSSSSPASSATTTASAATPSGMSNAVEEQPKIFTMRGGNDEQEDPTPLPSQAYGTNVSSPKMAEPDEDEEVEEGEKTSAMSAQGSETPKKNRKKDGDDEKEGNENKKKSKSKKKGDEDDEDEKSPIGLSSKDVDSAFASAFTF